MTTEKFAAYRKAAYATVAAVMAILAAVGVVDGDQADTWLGVATRLLDVLAPLAASLALAVAASKTKPGSDDPTTVADVEAAREQGRAEILTGLELTPNPGEPEYEPAPEYVAEGLPVYDAPTSNN